MNTIQAAAIAVLCIGAATKLPAQKGTVAAGGEGTGGGGSVSYSIGQIDYTTQSNSNGTIAQGIQHPYESFTVTGLPEGNTDIRLSVGPNPSHEQLCLRVQSPFEGELLIQLHDLNGRLLYTQSTTKQENWIPMQSFASATYLLQVSKGETTWRTFQIVKH